MSASLLARQLFAEPGAAGAPTRHLLAQAAAAHARLLDSAPVGRHPRLDRLRDSLGVYLRGPAPAAEKRFLLDDPQFVESLHALAAASPDLTNWDAAVSPSSQRQTRAAALPAYCGLSNVVAAVLLRHARNWCGTLELAADDYGRVHVPFSDWAVVLSGQRNGHADLFARQTLRLRLDARRACWSLGGDHRQPLVHISRWSFNAMFIDNRDVPDASAIHFCASQPRVRFERAARLGHTSIRFEPICPDAPTDHAELTGGIVAALIEAIEHNAPHIHNQLCQCIRTIQGFELPPHGPGQIASFSLPTSPGVIGFNVGYTPRDEPRLSPYCFTWLGHELGHTLSYLIDDVAFTHGWRFLENPLELTPVVPRYGRRLYVRTLFQIPYVHLFEWWLLMLFFERGFAGLPWRVFDDTRAVGDDVCREIAEAFDLIDEHARLTTAGWAVFARLRELVADARVHWRRLTRVLM